MVSSQQSSFDRYFENELPGSHLVHKLLYAQKSGSPRE
uniref:Uncharacterized protein n=1 Tax=Anguilla anguilla TaxID=7936 RepID=A0A0E9TN27_ANGAN